MSRLARFAAVVVAVAAGAVLWLPVAVAQARFTWTTSLADDQAITDPTTGAVDGEWVGCPTATKCIAIGTGADPSNFPYGYILSASVFSPGDLAVATHAVLYRYVDLPESGNPPISVACPTLSRCVVDTDWGDVITVNPVTGAPGPAFTIGDGQYYNTSGGPLACPTWFRCIGTASSSGTNVVVNLDPWFKGSLTLNALATSNGLDTLACPTPTQCTAIDLVYGSSPGSGAEAVTFDPATSHVLGTTTIVPFSAAGVSPFYVACPSSRQCTAMISDETAVTFDPQSGSVIDTEPDNAPQEADGLGEQAIACLSGTDCVEIGAPEVMYEGNPLSPDGWRPEPISGPAPSTDLWPNSIACPTRRECVAIGWGLTIGTSAG